MSWLLQIGLGSVCKTESLPAIYVQYPVEDSKYLSTFQVPATNLGQMYALLLCDELAHA